ncbi:TPA: hypothetical protein OOF66_003368 [Morganella morganii]|nr:hypothetical protein [Salmonella enterica subsp. enterica serovar Hadar]HCR4037097.1 hypothetical protein [Morganella morganii]HCR4053893.1 hypothetical protein [Morganella morganii]
MHTICETENFDYLNDAVNAEAWYWIAREKAAKTDVTEITEEEYTERMNTLTPYDRQGAFRSETFKFMEMYLGNITDIFAKIDGRYFTFRDQCYLAHSEIIRRVYESPVWLRK